MTLRQTNRAYCPSNGFTRTGHHHEHQQRSDQYSAAASATAALGLSPEVSKHNLRTINTLGFELEFNTVRLTLTSVCPVDPGVNNGSYNEKLIRVRASEKLPGNTGLGCINITRSWGEIAMANAINNIIYRAVSFD